MTKYLIGEELKVDSTKRTVYKNNKEVLLPELSYRLLTVLISNAPNVVSHDKLIAFVWQDRIVSDENLKKQISKLRQIIGDNSARPIYIVSERGLGYRCCATVTVVPQTTPNHPQPEEEKKCINPQTAKRDKLNPLLYVALVALVAISLIAIYVGQSTNFTTAEKSKENLSRESTNNKYFRVGAKGSDGATEDVFNATQHYFRLSDVDNQTAISLYNKALASNAESHVIYSGLANALSQSYFHFNGDLNTLQSALSFAIQAIKLAPEQAEGYHALGYVQYLSGQHQKAIKAFKKSRKLAPNWGSTLAYSALVHLEAGQLVLAYQKAYKAYEHDSTNPVNVSVLALCYRVLGLIDLAKSSLNQVIKIEPSHLLANNFQAELYLAASDIQQTDQILQRTLSFHPNNQHSLWLMALRYIQSRELTLAIEALQTVAAIGGRYQLPAKIYIALNNQDKKMIIALDKQLDELIEQGNLWSELYFSKALIHLFDNNEKGAIEYFQQSISAGMTDEYRFKNDPFLKEINKNPNFQKHLDTLKQQVYLQRKKVVALELLMQEI